MAAAVACGFSFTQFSLRCEEPARILKGAAAAALRDPSPKSAVHTASGDERSRNVDPRRRGQRGERKLELRLEGSDVNADRSAALRAEGGFGSAFVRQWRGTETSWGRSRARSVAGLDGSARRVVEGDRESPSWWQKLDVVRALLAGDLGRTERLESLINSAIYLKWINTGQVPCREGGELEGLNRLAKISQYIFRELERILSAKRVSLEEVLVVRKIHTYLLSFKAEFTDPGPSIRSNGVPHGLKRLSIHDKLHRSAGPEDLVATEALLARCTEPSGQCTEDFVAQLKIFHSELKRFFNATSLAEKLGGLRDSLDKPQLPLLDHVYNCIKKLDCVEAKSGSHAEVSDSLIEALKYLTDLRTVFTNGLESGIRNDAPDTAIAMRQKWRLSEIGLEDHASLLLDRYVAALESTGGTDLLAKQVNSPGISAWTQPLRALALGLRQLRRSGWLPRECLKIENELSVWQTTVILQKESLAESGSEDDRTLRAPRLVAILAQSRHLADTYTDTVVHLYHKPVERLGRALGIPEDSLQNFAEAESRSSFAFQFSRLVCVLLNATGNVLLVDGMEPRSALLLQHNGN